MIENDIISDVADMYGITTSDILSKRRVRRYVDARKVISHVLYHGLGMTLSEIGRILHCTHATIIYFNRKADDWLNFPVTNNKGASIIRELEERYG